VDEWTLAGSAVAVTLSGLLVYLRRGRLRLRIQASFRSPPRSEPTRSEEPPPFPRKRYESTDDDG